MNLIKQIFDWLISQSEIRNSAAAEKNWIPPRADGLQAKAGINSFPQTPSFLSARLEFKIRNSDFRQKMFELCPTNTARFPSLNRSVYRAF
jgi:hypothetical protein